MQLLNLAWDSDLNDEQILDFCILDYIYSSLHGFSVRGKKCVYLKYFSNKTNIWIIDFLWFRSTFLNPLKSRFKCFLAIIQIPWYGHYCGALCILAASSLLIILHHYVINEEKNLEELGKRELMIIYCRKQTLLIMI